MNVFDRHHRNSDDVTDRRLLTCMTLGDRSALASLYHGYHDRLVRFLSRLTRRHDVIDEVINDCLWIAWQKAGDFRGESRASTWIMGIAYRCVLKTLRQRGDEPVDEDAIPESRTPSTDPGDERELRDWLAKGFSHLTADQRVVVELVYGVGHNINDVASIMGCRVGTVKARLFHARSTLRHVLPKLAGERHQAANPLQ